MKTPIEVIVFGEDVADPKGGVFKATVGLLEEFVAGRATIEASLRCTPLDTPQGDPFVQRLLDDGMLKAPMLKKYRRLNVHAIRGGADLVDHSLHTKFDTSWRFLTSLRDMGRAAADAVE